MKASPSIDHSERQVLPASMAIDAGPLRRGDSTRRRFNDSDWQKAQLRRELRDRPSFTESIQLESTHATTRFIDHQTKRETARSVVMFAAPAIEPMLAIANEAGSLFEMPISSMQEAAAEQLAKIGQRERRKTPQIVVVKPALSTKHWLSLLALLVVTHVLRSMM